MITSTAHVTQKSGSASLVSQIQTRTSLVLPTRGALVRETAASSAKRTGTPEHRAESSLQKALDKLEDAQSQLEKKLDGIMDRLNLSVEHTGVRNEEEKTRGVLGTIRSSIKLGQHTRRSSVV